ncbi:MAG: TrkA C-terminal domain-containing protein, partial [Nanoarchaeota archaeon]
VIDVVESSKWVANAAKNMSETVLEGKALHPVIKEALKATDESIVRVVVTNKSILKDRTLGDLKLRTEMGIHIIAIRRGNKWIFNPKKHTDILENDIMFAVGPTFSCKKLNKLAKGEVKKI